MWTKSTTDIKEGLDEILQIKQPKSLAEKKLRRHSRPHRPKDRITHTLELDPIQSEVSGAEKSQVSG